MFSLSIEQNRSILCALYVGMHPRKVQRAYALVAGSDVEAFAAAEMVAIVAIGKTLSAVI